VTALSLILKPSREDRPILIAALFIVAILIAGTAYTLERFGSAPLLSPNYLLQQLQIGAFLGIVAAGMMVIILISKIDLSVPWTLAGAAMMATAVGGPSAIPIGLAVGLAVGVFNGLGVAYLRVPSTIFMLGVNAVMRGLMVANTGGFAPQTTATDLMRTLAAEKTFGIPNALFV
jgi:ribose transport system permease protein